MKYRFSPEPGEKFGDKPRKVFMRGAAAERGKMPNYGYGKTEREAVDELQNMQAQYDESDRSGFAELPERSWMEDAAKGASVIVAQMAEQHTKCVSKGQASRLTVKDFENTILEVFAAHAPQAAPSSSATPDKSYLTALRIMLEGKSGAAQNAVREDYPEMAALVDQFSSSASEYETFDEWAKRVGYIRESWAEWRWNQVSDAANRYAAERRVR